MGKLNNFGPSDIDDRNQTGTRRQDRFARIHWAPIWIKRGCCCLVEANSKYLGKFFNAKRTKRDSEASEETLCVFSLLLIDAKKCPSICFIKTLWKVAQNTPNTCRKTATQSVNLTNHPTKPMTCVSIYCKSPDNVHNNLHAVCPVRKCIDDQLLVLLSPIPHLPV